MKRELILINEGYVTRWKIETEEETILAYNADNNILDRKNILIIIARMMNAIMK